MVYIKDWENFVQSIIDLFFESPVTSRFSIKYTHSKKLAILKGTDNKKVFQYKCRVVDEFQKIEQITQLVTKIFGNVPEPEQPEKMEVEQQEQQSQQKKQKKKKKQGKKK